MLLTYYNLYLINYCKAIFISCHCPLQHLIIIVGVVSLGVVNWPLHIYKSVIWSYIVTMSVYMKGSEP